VGISGDGRVLGKEVLTAAPYITEGCGSLGQVCAGGWGRMGPGSVGHGLGTGQGRKAPGLFI